MVGFLKRAFLWWQRRKEKEGYYYRPDKIFRNGDLEIAVRKIERPLPSRWLKYVMPSFVIIMKTNWLIAEEEINERSNHPLANELRKLNPSSTTDLRELRFLGFSIYGNSVMIEPLMGGNKRKVWKVVGDIARVLFEWELLRKKVAAMLIENE